MTQMSISAETAPAATVLKVRVSTFKLAGLDNHKRAIWEFVSDRIVNHNDADDRKWLGKHCFWAFRNNHKVVTHPEI